MNGSTNQNTGRLADILEAHIAGNLSVEEARQKVQQEFTEVTADELALAEQELTKRGVKDSVVYDSMESFLLIFQDVLKAPDLHLADWHPIRTYQRENEAVEELLKKAEGLSRSRFVLNQWAEVIEGLLQYEIHLSRKQNQLYPAFEQQGFDRPSKIMWTLDDAVRSALRTAATLLRDGQEEEFLSQYDRAAALLKELIEKESIVLFPAAMEMIRTKEFLAIRRGDDEIGYCLIDPPPQAPMPSGTAKTDEEETGEDGFMKDLQQLLQKHGMGAAAGEMDVRQGKLTLEQINLIFRHLPIDLSYVDENELVRFYSDTKHRVFPRSPGVIGRNVKNCHPRESVHTVEEIIKAFREGREDEAEFWLEMGGKFIYIYYTAVRDDKGAFKGVLEMMQDATHIRSLEGSQRLLTWDSKDHGQAKAHTGSEASYESSHGFTPETTIGDAIKRYPALRSWLPTLSPQYKKLTNPLAFKAMAHIATLDMVAQRGGFTVNELIRELDQWADSQAEEET
ncbi:MAG: PAS domain-containing protein [Lacrimispora sp.]|uniref:PAS domain-containing protein n=1 Tax=Lacrimispora sp. TaxID=2719234 RepID=UPI0039E2D3F6